MTDYRTLPTYADTARKPAVATCRYCKERMTVVEASRAGWIITARHTACVACDRAHR